MIVINYGTEVEIINTYGWLLKKYKSTQEVKDVVLSNHYIGIVYKDKVELINV